MTYGLIAKEINAMVGTKFGPAETPAAAEKCAEVELAKRIPAALGTNPTNWFNVLETMLGMTLKRDRQHLHDVIPGKTVQRGKTFIRSLEATETTNIDHIDSADIVNYPSGNKAAPTVPANSPDPSTEPNPKDETK